MKTKLVWAARKGDLVKVKLYDYDFQGPQECHGIVMSEKFDDENTMFPCVMVYIFGLKDSQRCMPHQLEILSSAS
jgi:hypothetical protein